ncbi:MAG: calcium-binding protein, partial [Methylococcales bacterium]|nr:calcium-binding protein [Methylococcales bacterium]
GDAATTITTIDGLVASGANLKVDGSGITTNTNALTFNGSAETDGAFSVIGGAGSDTITGSSGNDTITGGAGSDSMTGGAGADTFDVTDTSGVDTITDWGVGVDVLSGAYSGAGTLKVTISDLSVTALDLTTALGSAGATASVTGGSGNDTITGGADSDVINGGAGSDVINGGAGSDTINGGTGSDTIDGGAGSDTIIIDSTGEIITIQNFAAGDKLEFFHGAILNIVVDSDDTDGIQDLIATDPVSGIDTTIHFTGIGATADAAWYNIPSFTTAFAGSTITIL